MAYATTDDVLSRVGRVGSAFQIAGKKPDLTDVAGFLDQLSSEIDDAIRGAGYDPTGLDVDSKNTLLDLVAYGAAARSLRALGDRSPEVLEILTEADAVWMAAMGDPTSRQAEAIAGSIASGTHPVIRALGAGQGGSPEIMGGDFWEDESNYGRPEAMLSERLALRGTNLAPTFSRGQHL